MIAVKLKILGKLPVLGRGKICSFLRNLLGIFDAMGKFPCASPLRTKFIPALKRLNPHIQ